LQENIKPVVIVCWSLRSSPHSPTHTTKNRHRKEPGGWTFNIFCFFNVPSRETLYSPVQWDKISQDVCSAPTHTMPQRPPILHI